MAKKNDVIKETDSLENTEDNIEIRTDILPTVSKIVRVVSRVDYPVIISYGNEMKRLPPRFNDLLEASKLPDELPTTLQIIDT